MPTIDFLQRKTCLFRKQNRNKCDKNIPEALSDVSAKKQQDIYIVQYCRLHSCTVCAYEWSLAMLLLLQISWLNSGSFSRKRQKL